MLLKANIKVTKSQGLQGRYVKFSTRKCVVVTKQFTKRWNFVRQCGWSQQCAICHYINAYQSLFARWYLFESWNSFNL